MYAIASILDPKTDQDIRRLWEDFEVNCGLTGIKMTPIPHFSWQGADAYQLEPVEEILEELASNMSPFRVHAAGLGVFTGEQPVIYVPIVKNQGLFEIHRALWEAARPFAVVPNLHYDPDRWMPHITLAYRERDPARLGCAFATMISQRLELEIKVDHFAILYQTDGKAGLRNRFAFRGTEP